MKCIKHNKEFCEVCYVDKYYNGNWEEYIVNDLQSAVTGEQCDEDDNCF